MSKCRPVYITLQFIKWPRSTMASTTVLITLTYPSVAWCVEDVRLRETLADCICCCALANTVHSGFSSFIGYKELSWEQSKQHKRVDTHKRTDTAYCSLRCSFVLLGLCKCSRWRHCKVPSRLIRAEVPLRNHWFTHGSPLSSQYWYVLKCHWETTDSLTAHGSPLSS